MTYTYLAADLATGALIPPELPLVGVSWGRQINGSGPLTARLQLVPPVDDDNRRLVEAYKDATDRKRRVIYVLRDGVPMGVYEIHERRYDLVTQSIAIKGQELFSHLGDRVHGNGGTAAARTQLLTHTGVPIQVALDIIGTRAASIGLDLSAVTVPATGPTITYEGRAADGKYIDQIINDLSKAEGQLGFDYRVDLAGEGTSFQRRLIMAPFVGADVGLIAKLTRPDGQGNVVAGGVLEDSRRANLVITLGTGEGVGKATAEASTADWGPRATALLTLSNESDVAVLQARADARLRAVAHVSLPSISLRSDQVDAQLGTFAPGDVGTISIEADSDPWWPDGAWLKQRIIAFDVDVPDEGDGETITFKFDDPVGDFGG